MLAYHVFIVCPSCFVPTDREYYHALWQGQVCLKHSHSCIIFSFSFPQLYNWVTFVSTVLFMLCYAIFIIHNTVKCFVMSLTVMLNFPLQLIDHYLRWVYQTSFVCFLVKILLPYLHCVSVLQERWSVIPLPLSLQLHEVSCTLLDKSIDFMSKMYFFSVIKYKLEMGMMYI